MSRLRFLAIGLESRTDELLKASLASAQVIRMPCDPVSVIDPVNPAPDAILCGPAPANLSPLELAQALSMVYKGVPSYYVAFERQGYDRKNFMRHGFTDACLLPFDEVHLRNRIGEVLARNGTGSSSEYRPVKLVDLDPETSLDFDTSIHLPANRKFLKFTSAGDPIGKERYDRLTGGKLNTVYVSQAQIAKFHKYTADRLKSLGIDLQICESEKKTRLESAVRDIFSSLFTDSGVASTFDQGKAILSDCQKIVAGVVAEGQLGEWYEQFLITASDGSSTYCHANNVSTYAALFSIGLRIGKPGELALAGLLHDIGLAEIAPEILLKEERLRTVVEQDAYKRHPELTIRILMGRKLLLPETVKRAILQHHEWFNGSGYPHGLAGTRVCVEGQLLALADTFDKLTRVEEGKTSMSPRDAVEHLSRQVLIDPARMQFDPELLRKVLRLFPE